jgi:sec-independent protein translocase protein TatA
METMVGIIQDIGPAELLLVLVMALLLFGARRLPEVARSAGQAMAEFKRALRGPNDRWGEGSGADYGAGATREPDRQDEPQGSPEITEESGKGRSP